MTDAHGLRAGRRPARSRVWRRVFACACAAMLLATLTVTAPVGAAAVRYATPDGAGSTCTEDAPCSVATALKLAPSGAIVDIRGDAGDYAIKSEIVAASGITVQGSHGRPRLVFASGGLNLIGSTARMLSVTARDTSTAFRLRDGASVDGVIVQQRGSGHACYLGDGTAMRNSICWADGRSDLAIETDGSTTLRNVTAYGGTEAAILAFGRKGECACDTATMRMRGSRTPSTRAASSTGNGS